MKPPFRADHVGSLLRPQDLHEARAKNRRGELSDAELKKIQDKDIRDAVKLQEDLGLQAITDGEFRRDWWHIDFLAGFDGVELKQEDDPYHGVQFKGTEAKPPTMHVTRKLRRTKPSMVPHFEFLKSVVRKGTPKFTMPSPAMLHARGDRDSIRKTYPNADNFWADLTQCYREEIAELYKAGCRYLQIDDTTIAMFGDPKVQETFRKLGDDPKKDVATYAEAVNAAIRDVPDDMTVCIHTCRGNFRSTWLAKGGYDYVAQTAFSTIDVDGFFLEYDDERSGGFEPLRAVPEDRDVVLGLLTTKTPRVEPVDELRRRIDDAAKHLPLARLALSPQCGFASMAEGNLITPEEQWKKLELVADVAKRVWGTM